MTADNNGTGASRDDDPFAYLYRPEGGGTDGAGSAYQAGASRRSANQVRAVGERQFGGQAGAQQFPQQAAPGEGQPNAHYAAPEVMAGGRAALRQQGGGAHGSRGGGGNRTGLLAGAVAVVAAVVLGIGAAMYFNGGEEEQGAHGDASPSASEETKRPPKDKPSGDAKPTPADLPKEDAAALRLGGEARVARDIPGAKGKDGTYVAGMENPGASAQWTADVEKAGKYWFYVQYGVPGTDQHLSLSVNDKPHATGLDMKNHADAKKGDWENGWTYTYAFVQLDEGSNTFTISCGDGDKCDVNLDQVWLAPPGEKPGES
ncbi:hypothetical protein [Streptomyces oceani]|uniref:CBM6 domain-containing protein n=1 Tax=Streptomyces oceani TaxID=1075402 RepID=A0A1E7KLZ1_9ACTN|nr:hypothetical protein [Streptomyces oceani]OEV04965.1 hypothetical protein AN216_04985 [Streptomyces oceani]